MEIINYNEIEAFIVDKWTLKELLDDIGDIPGSSDIENQITFIENKTASRISRDLKDARDELVQMRLILREISKTKDISTSKKSKDESI